MGRTKPERRRRFGGRVVRSNNRSGWFYELFPDFSWPVFNLTILFSVLAFSPLLAISIFELEGIALKLMAALSPVVVCLAFAIASYVYGKRAQMEAFSLWMVVGMFVVLGLLAGVGLFFSV